MNNRERFNATIKFEKTDRPFRWEAPAVWPAAVKKWHKEGLPEHITCSDMAKSEIYDYFGMDKLVWLPFEGGWAGNPYCPMFEPEFIKEDGEHNIIMGQDGTVVRIKKDDPDTSMPQFLKFPVETREDFVDKIEWRLDYKSKERFPAGWKDLVSGYKKRDYPLGFFVIGPFGYLRNLMGDENLMYTFFDDPDFIVYMMKCWRKYYEGFIDILCDEIVPDFIMVWEDMCYKSGPLISPDIYKEFLMEPLKDIVSILKSKGVEGFLVDNDGDLRKMIPIYLECGVNAFYPFEVQAGMDIVALRKQYGKSFAIIGGLDKKTLAVSEEAVKEEIENKVPFMLESGGYIPMADHSIPIDVSLKMFWFFVDYLRSRFG